MKTGNIEKNIFEFANIKLYIKTKKKTPTIYCANLNKIIFIHRFPCRLSTKPQLPHRRKLILHAAHAIPFWFPPHPTIRCRIPRLIVLSTPLCYGNDSRGLVKWLVGDFFGLHSPHPSITRAGFSSQVVWPPTITTPTRISMTYVK